MQERQNNVCTEQERIQLLLKKMEEEYTQLGKRICCLVLDASRRIDSYADEIIDIKQKREDKSI